MVWPRDKGGAAEGVATRPVFLNSVSLLVRSRRSSPPPLKLRVLPETT